MKRRFFCAFLSGRLIVAPKLAKTEAGGSGRRKDALTSSPPFTPGQNVFAGWLIPPPLSLFRHLSVSKNEIEKKIFYFSPRLRSGTGWEGGEEAEMVLLLEAEGPPHISQEKGG